jgi:hypothetical protein
VAYDRGPTVMVAGSDAQYDYTLLVGPRSYRNYFNQVRALDAGPVRVGGRLWHDGQVIAWCSAAFDRLETPNGIESPPDFEPAMRRLQFTPVPVTCMGPAAAAVGLGRDPTVTVEWDVRMTLIGGRLERTRGYSGIRVASVRPAGTEASESSPPLTSRR